MCTWRNLNSNFKVCIILENMLLVSTYSEANVVIEDSIMIFQRIEI